MLRNWLIAVAAALAFAGLGVSPSFGAACTPTTTPNTTGTTQNSVLELLESICTNGGGGGGGLSVAYGGAIGANGTPVGLKDPGTGFLQPFQGDTTNGLWVNVKTGSLVGVGQNAAIAGLTGSLVVGKSTTALQTCVDAQTCPLSIDQANGALRGEIIQGSAVLSATNGLYANILQGNVALSATNPIFASLSGATPVTPVAAAASDNHAVLKNGAGIAMSVHTSNNSATKNYLRLYDAGTGFNGCNSATGVIFAMEIPPTDGGFSVSLGGGAGITFTNGLSWCITSAFGLTDTTNATASAIYANASYK